MGSTQSTILALKALILYMDEYSGIRGQGSFNLYIDGKLISTLKFDENTPQGSYEFSKEIQQFLHQYASKAKTHNIEIKVEDYVPSKSDQKDFQLSYTL